jgi:UDP-N-acetylglucosamine:LPS N-acetylglucosamine transferase
MKIALVCSHGGHLTEMKQIETRLRDADRFYLTYPAETTRSLPRAYFLPQYTRFPHLIPLCLWKIFRILLRERPDVIISTGAELAVPVFYLSLFFPGVRRVYVECSAQVFRPSLTGKLVIGISHLFLVQWKFLLEKYGPRARYVGGLI